MKTIYRILLACILLAATFAQQAKAQNHSTITTAKQQVKPCHFTEKSIAIEIDSCVKNTIFIFYYLPDSSYSQLLERRNNLVGKCDVVKKVLVNIPDTTIGAKLLFRGIGYEPYEVNADSLCNGASLNVKLTPKIYTNIAILSQRVNTDSTTHIDFHIANEEPAFDPFYETLGPLYDEELNMHIDPIFSRECFGCCYPHVKYVELKMLDNAMLNQLYAALKKGQTCSMLFTVNGNSVMVEAEQLPKEMEGLEQAMHNIKWSKNDDIEAHSYQYRLVFDTDIYKLPIDKTGEVLLSFLLSDPPLFLGENFKKTLPPYIQEHLQYPEHADVIAKIYVEFTIEVDGSVTNIKVLRSVDPMLDAEAVKVIQNMPKWTPGILRGEIVRSKVVVPVSFQLSY